MLRTILAILFILWALGLVTSYTTGGIFHLPLVIALIVLLVIALVMLVINLVQGRRI